MNGHPIAEFAESGFGMEKHTVVCAMKGKGGARLTGPVTKCGSVMVKLLSTMGNTKMVRLISGGFSPTEPAVLRYPCLPDGNVMAISQKAHRALLLLMVIIPSLMIN